MGYEKRWEIVRPLGEGGQGRVHLVRDKTLYGGKDFPHGLVESIKKLALGGFPPDRTLEICYQLRGGMLDLIAAESPENLGALKILHKPEGSRDPARAFERIRNEITAMGRIPHPNLLGIRAASAVDGWFVSEYHARGPLANAPELFKSQAARALIALRPLVEAVARLHEQKIVHRDIKPANVFHASDGRLVLGDFGLVFFTDEKHTRLSATLENVGTRDWMPSWAMGMRIEDVRPSFDVFTLGKLLWSMISGKSFLRLWYFDREGFDVERMFPDSPYMSLATEIFRETIVENEDKCLADAGLLLEKVDRALQIIDLRADLISGKLVRRCRVCGVGKYALIANRDRESLRQFGVEPVGQQSLKVFACNHCGHAQLFRTVGDQDPPAWSEGGPSSVPGAGATR